MNRPSIFLMLATLALLAATSSCISVRDQDVKEQKQAAMQTKFPEFSWDQIPRYMHVWKMTPYTNEELDYLATFPLITFEKAQGTARGSVQEGTLQAARAVKQRNPDARILYYKNIVIDWPGSTASKELETIDGGYLQSIDGSYPVVNANSNCKFFDISRPEVQDWWMNDAARMLGDPSIDGIFIDANIKVLHPSYFSQGKKVGKQKAAQLRAGYERLLNRINRELRPDNIVLANILRAFFKKGGLEYIHYFDGSYLEGFESNVDGLSRPDYIARGIAYAQEAARQGKIIAFSIGLGEELDEDSSGIGLDEARQEIESLAAVEARLNYVVALFLVIAEKYSYFLPYGGTYGVDARRTNATWMADMPIFRKRLGPPRGPATKSGYIYTREFEHCSVWLDIENETAKLTWKSSLNEAAHQTQR